MNSYVNMGVGALLGTVFVLMSVSIASEGIFHSGAPEKEGFAIVAEETGGEAAGGGEAAATVPIATLLATADAAAGETAFKKCASCHTSEKGGPNKVGPGLWDIVNRPVASHEGFSYSAGMTTFSEGHKVLWDYDHLSYFLEAPKKHVPGTAMGFAGLKKNDERANLIAYLRTLSDNPAPLPTVSNEGADAGSAAPADGATATEGAAPADGAATTTEGAAPADGAATTTQDAAPAEGGATTTEGAAPAEGGTATEGTTTEQPAQ
ncbi:MULTISPECIES: c-type cytochrome [unclassified Shinella]|uniref:c-type cytochrome n=1 Tax=Shinella TaxID=323620 RepID=UPI00225C88A7|nr:MULTISPECIES: c-type cytochrome [unclassified Shinella]CAI0340818.1 membrane c-type cytochrome cy [Rhizobiaceae bacterium]CAK7259162.1 cytochrome c [Shinella sp. WSC3-e]MCO5136993.1 c-type cytochrome [Shinella sp.]MCW5706718.1 c-type cytochrome [Shinella sp.]MDC7253329.1 c-type cytochrome [Shinella sp. YE25]